jgi:microcystin-dependent protein
MAAELIEAIIRVRRGTGAEWTLANPTLKLGELGLETDTGKYKAGDGVTAWTSLGYTIGADGIAATITVGALEMVDWDDPLEIVNTGTSLDAVFSFKIPRGLPGLTVPDINTLDENTAPADTDNLVTEDTIGQTRRLSLAGLKTFLASVFGSLSNTPTADQKSALAGMDGTPSSSNPYATKDTIDGLGVMMTGALIMWPIASAPTNWLLCDGSAVSRTTYADLFALLGESWGAGDGSTTFNLPDFREASPYGVGTRAAGVAAHDAATMAQFKDDQSQAWQLGATADDNGARNYWGYSAARDTVPTASAYINICPLVLSTLAQGLSRMLKAMNDGTNGDIRSGTVTRGKLLGINFIIKT